MASRAVLPRQQPPPRGEVKLKMAAEEARTRRVLSDIGNLVIDRPVEGKPLPHISQPVTMNFRSRFLAEGRASFGNNEKETSETVGGDPARKAGMTKATTAGKKESKKYKNDRESIDEIKTRRKNVKTLSSILSGRSKAACELKNGGKTLVNIDEGDAHNELAVIEYIDDMYKFYKLTEDQNRVDDYLDSQKDINAKMRSILIDWLIEVHCKFELMPETLYLTVYIVDRFLSTKAVQRKELQLVGISSMLLACKYEEIWAPEVNDFVSISANAYVREQILAMEKTILGKLQWQLTVPTPHVFLIRYIKASESSDQEMESMVYFLAELGLMHYPMVVSHSPSMLAASAVYVARCTFDKSPYWTATLEHHTGYFEHQLKECAKILVGLHIGAAHSSLKAVHRKYMSSDHFGVALLNHAEKINGNSLDYYSVGLD